MKIEIGKEMEFVGHRLTDIVFLAENTAPAEGCSWESYAKDVLKMIANQARNAQGALNVTVK